MTLCYTGCGVVFKLDKAGNETVLHSFTGGADGWKPVAGLIRDSAGNLYGTTSLGGEFSCSAGCGVVFKVDVKGKETVLYSFSLRASLHGSPDGIYPSAGLIRDAAGNLYGTTVGGGTYGLGTVFKLTPTGTETILHSFTGLDAASPAASLIRDAGGSFYGTASGGGAFGLGVVFKLDTQGRLSVVHDFDGSGGANPYSSLIRDSGGNFYGTTFKGGASDVGVAYKITP
jgi:uncharacterized repeat protein (TIGR03803 family)